MTESIQMTIIQVAQADPETSAEQLAALRSVCAGKYPARRAPRRLVRAPEARRILGGTKPIAPATLHRWIADGRIHAYGNKGVQQFDLAELYACIGITPEEAANV